MKSIQSVRFVTVCEVKKIGWNTDLETKIGSSSPNQPKRRAYVNLHDDVPGIVRRGMQHAVIGESGIVNDVVELSVFPEGTRPCCWYGDGKSRRRRV